MEDIHPWPSLSVKRLLVPRQKEGWTERHPDLFCITVLTRGQLRMEITEGQREAQVVDIKEGAAWQTPPGRALTLNWHALVPGPVEITKVFLPITVFSRFTEQEPGDRQVPTLRTIPRQNPLIASVVQDLLEAQRAGLGEPYAESAVRFLVTHLLMSAPQGPEPAADGALGAHRLSAVTSYLHEHLSGRISLDDMAEQAGLSRFHFTRLFAAATGRTPYQFLTELRMGRARRLLEHSGESIPAIGRRCGYPNAKHFATAFRREVGCPPSHYRQQARLRTRVSRTRHTAGWPGR